ncbi:hypothetical protein AALP_AA1G000300 [Arabis alpina]|uniref:NAC domain-containing protein n=1 Tax=Arabis alpina TaxID=50452 RepID=A0A087HK39_ARAAL|nr:hypothetical protein AALP_AA1G000300 [Arabis alpina]
MEMNDKPGFGFRPYDEELVGFYLRNKILGNNSLVQEAIREVKIYSYDPWKLRYQSKIKSRDHVWYFFCSKENKYANGDRQSRTTSNGFWKITGVPVKVVDQWGLYGVPGVIGYKRTLVFQKDKNSKGVKSDWVMQEFHYTLLPENHQRSYVLCRLEYKGDDKNILLENATDPTPTYVANMTYSSGSVVDQPVQENSGYFSEFESANHQGQWFPRDSDMHQSGSFNDLAEYDSTNQDQWLASGFNMQQQAPYSNPYGEESEMIWKYVVEENHESLLDERMFMQNFSDHRPKNPVTGILAYDSSDSDTDSMIGGDTSSFTDSVGSSNGPYHSAIDDILSSSTIEPFHEAQEQPKQGKEKVINKQRSEYEWKMAQDSIKKTPSTKTVKQNWIVLEKMHQRKSQWIYLMNMIIGFLLFFSIIGWIMLL